MLPAQTTSCGRASNPIFSAWSFMFSEISGSMWIMQVARRTPPPRHDSNDDISLCLLPIDFPERISLSLN